MRIIEIDMKQTRTITLRISKDLNEEIERIVREKGYGSKSEFIREALNEFLEEYMKQLASISEINEWSSREAGGDYEGVKNPNLVMIY